MHPVPLLLIPLIALLPLRSSDELRAPTDTSVRVLTEDLPPLAYIDHASGHLVGASAELVSSGMRTAGIARQIEVLPWARALETAKTRPNTFLFNLARTPDREKDFRWVYRTARKRIGVFRLSRRTDLRIGSFDDLGSHRIAVLNRNIAHMLLLSKGLEANLISALPEQRPQIDLLFARRVDLWVRTYLTTDDLDDQIRAAGHDPREVVKAWDLEGGSVDLYLAANPRTSDSLVERVRRALHEVH